jgi:DNA-binding transcriptional LysR family regulator
VAAFVAVVDAGGFNAASRHLGLSAQAVQKAVDRMEAELGLRLFTRAASRRPTLTEAGMAYLEGCRRVLAAIEETGHVLAGFREGESSLLRVSMPRALGRLHLLPALRGFLDCHPGIRVAALLTERSPDLVDEGVDVVFSETDHTESRVAFRTLAMPKFRISASPDYLARHDTPRDLGDLWGGGHECINLVSPITGRLFPWSLRTAIGGSESRTMPGRLAVTESDAALAAALAGLGLAQLPDHVAGRALAAGELIEVLPDQRHDAPPISIRHHPDRHMLPKVQAFIDYFVGWSASWADGAIALSRVAFRSESAARSNEREEY